MLTCSYNAVWSILWYGKWDMRGDHGEGVMSPYLKVQGRLPKEGMYKLISTGWIEESWAEDEKQESRGNYVCEGWEARSRRRADKQGDNLDTAVGLRKPGDGRRQGWCTGGKTLRDPLIWVLSQEQSGTRELFYAGEGHDQVYTSERSLWL